MLRELALSGFCLAWGCGTPAEQSGPSIARYPNAATQLLLQPLLPLQPALAVMAMVLLLQLVRHTQALGRWVVGLTSPA